MGTESPPPKGAQPERAASFLSDIDDEIEFDVAFDEEPPTLPQDGQPTSEGAVHAGASDAVPPPEAVPKPPLEIDLPGDDTRLVVELMPDGRLRAPVQAAREILRDRLRKAEVLRTGRTWAVLRSLDLGPKASWAKDSQEREVVAAGAIGDGGLSLIDFIGFLATGAQTGVLTVAAGDVERSVYFFNGDVVWATSNAPQDRLGEFLLQRGKITREQLQVAIRDGERKFGRACVERGFIAAHELYAMVQAQLTETFDKLLATETGVWFFARISGTGLADSQIHLSTQGLLVDALRRLDELQVYRQRIRSADVLVQRMTKAQRGGAAPPMGATTGDILEEVEGAVREGAAQLLKQLPGSATISELMRILGRGEFEVTRAVYHLLKRNLVEIVQLDESGPIPRRVASISKTEVKEVIGIYSMAIREMFEEVARAGKGEALQEAADAFLKDDSTPYAHILRAASLGADGAIDDGALLAALQGMPFTSQELSDALSELLFFVLFQATEFLGRRRGDDLARRVKLILGMLAHTGVTSASSAVGG